MLFLLLLSFHSACVLEYFTLIDSWSDKHSVGEFITIDDDDDGDSASSPESFLAFSACTSSLTF